MFELYEYRVMSDGKRRIVETMQVPVRHTKKAARALREMAESCRTSGLRSGVLVKINGVPAQVGIRDDRLEVLWVEVTL